MNNNDIEYNAPSEIKYIDVVNTYDLEEEAVKWYHMVVLTILPVHLVMSGLNVLMTVLET